MEHPNANHQTFGGVDPQKYELHFWTIFLGGGCKKWDNDNPLFVKGRKKKYASEETST